MNRIYNITSRTPRLSSECKVVESCDDAYCISAYTLRYLENMREADTVYIYHIYVERVRAVYFCSLIPHKRHVAAAASVSFHAPRFPAFSRMLLMDVGIFIRDDSLRLRRYYY